MLSCRGGPPMPRVQGYAGGGAQRVALECVLGERTRPVPLRQHKVDEVPARRRPAISRCRGYCAAGTPVATHMRYGAAGKVGRYVYKRWMDSSCRMLRQDRVCMGHTHRNSNSLRISLPSSICRTRPRPRSAGIDALSAESESSSPPRHLQAPRMHAIAPTMRPA